jgi:HlyD family secretion protein
MDRKIPTPRWRSRRAMTVGAVVVSLAVAVVLVIAVTSGVKRSYRAPMATVTIETVQRGVFRDFTTLRGKVAPHDTIDLDALEGGQVREIMVQAGDMVSVGQPLLKFRNTQLELDVLDREGRLIESMTQLQTYEKQLEDTRLANQKAAEEIDYNIKRLSASSQRRDPLAARGMVAVETAENVRNELAYQQKLKVLQAESNRRADTLRLKQLPQIQTELAGLTQSLAVTRAKLDDLVVKAPVTGRLTDFELNVGQNRNRGDRLGVIVPNTGFKISATIDEYYLGRVRAGQIADATLNGRTWKLRVDRVYPQVKDGVFTIDLGFVGAPPADLLPGQAVDGRLSLGSDQPAVTLAVGPFLERTGGDWVMVMTGAHRAERRRIKLGRRSSDQVEILSGLSPGDRVITSDYTGFEKIDRVDLTS